MGGVYAAAVDRCNWYETHQTAINVGRGFADVTVLGYANLTTRRLFSCTFHCDVTIALIELTDDKERKKLPISIMVFTTAALTY